jgi:pimeloyl-ACP methyl ester carboxylesterase
MLPYDAVRLRGGIFFKLCAPKGKVGMSLKTFRIEIAKEVLDDLRVRLARTRWSFAVGDAGWDMGTELQYLKELMGYWRDEFHWARQEEELNRLNHFKTAIGEYGLHFIHQRGKGPHPTPLLLLHGWPDSFYRFHKIIPMLTDPGSFGGDPDDSFDVVIPSLPGFGFTDIPKARTQKQVIRHDAKLLFKLMSQVLGYERFAIAGGDGGSPLAQALAIDFSESVMGIYLTDLGWHVSSVDPSTLSKKEQHYLEASQKAFMKQGAYAMVQATKPQTLAFNLNDSPVGLASWIVDRFHFWTDGDIEEKFTKDELLTNITIYWVTETIASSIRNYYSETKSPSLTTADFVEVPVGLGLFPKDIGGVPPREFAERTLNLQHWTEMPRGGHFTAWEEPQLMASDMQVFFRKLLASNSG